MDIYYNKEKLTTHSMLITYCRHISNVVEKNNLHGFLSSIVLKTSGRNIDYKKFQTVMTTLGIIKLQKDYDCAKRYAGEYSIHRNRLLIAYFLCLSIDTLDSAILRRIGHKKYRMDIEFLYRTIYNCITKRIPLIFIKNLYKDMDALTNDIYDRLLYQFYYKTLNYLALHYLPLYPVHKNTPISFVRYFDISLSPSSPYQLNSISIPLLHHQPSNPQSTSINGYIDFTNHKELHENLLYLDYTKKEKSKEEVIVDKQVLEYISNNFDIISLREFNLSKEVLQQHTKEELCNAIASYSKTSSPLILTINQYIDKISDVKKSIFIPSFKVNPHLKTIDNKKTLYVSGRQYNQLCSFDTKLRDKYLQVNGFTIEIDLHSAIFSITRFLNKNEFKLSYDIKKRILEQKYTDIYGNQLTKPQIKSLLFRIYFAKDSHTAFTNYKKKDNPYLVEEYYDEEDIKDLPDLDEQTFNKIYDFTLNEIGDNQPFLRSIFIIESLVELFVIHHFSSNNYDIENVFDCFWLKGDQIDETTAENLLEEIVRNALYLIKNTIINYKN